MGNDSVSKERIKYKSFDELPNWLKGKFKCESKLGNSDRIKNGYVNLINLLNKQGDSLIGDYVGADIKVWIRFGECGHAANITPSNYKRGRCCGVCGGKQIQQGINDLATTHPILAKEWHPTKNSELTPHNVSQGSSKKVWWRCEEHGHEWEAFVVNRVGGKGCPYCSNKKVLKGYNDLATTNPQFIKYFANIKDAYTHTYSSSKKVELKCPDCGHTKAMQISKLTSRGFSCDSCSDGIGYPEKVMSVVLSKIGIGFVKQLSFDNGKHKYDFFLQDYNAILETHGEQHYEHSRRGRSLEEEQENDRYKRELAINNGILSENYHEIDCRHSTLEWCRPNIEKVLSNYVDMSVLTDEDWRQIDIQAQKSLKIEMCKYWKENKEVNGELTTQQVADVFEVGRSTVVKYLKWGDTNGLCAYDGKEEKGASYRRRSNFVYLIKPNGDKWFEKPMSMTELSRKSEIPLPTIKRNLGKGALKYNSKVKYNPKFIGSYIVNSEVFDNEVHTN